MAAERKQGKLNTMMPTVASSSSVTSREASESSLGNDCCSGSCILEGGSREWRGERTAESGGERLASVGSGHVRKPKRLREEATTNLTRMLRDKQQ